MILNVVIAILLVSFFIGLSISNSRREKNMNKELLKRKTRSYPQSVYVSLEDAEVKESAIAYTKNDSSYSIAHAMAKSFDEPKKNTNQVRGSYFIIDLKSKNGKTIQFQSPLFDMSSESLLMYLLTQKKTVVHYDDSDSSQYWIDIDFIDKLHGGNALL